MTSQVEQPEPTAHELHRQFEEALWRGAAQDRLARAERVIPLGERLLEIYQSHDDPNAWVGFKDVAYHLIVPYEERGDYHSHRHGKGDSDHPLALDSAIVDYTRAVEMTKQAEAGIWGRGERVAADKAAKLGERIAETLMRRAECYLRQGNRLKALRDAEFVVSAKPDQSASYMLRGRCHLAAGQLHKAGEDAKKALQLAGAPGGSGVGLYRRCYPELAAQHDANLERLRAAYEQGERDFSGIDLSWTSLRDKGVTDLRDCVLDHANLMYSNLSGVDLAGATLRYATLDHAHAWTSSGVSVSFSRSDLTLTDLRRTHFHEPDFRGAIVRHTDFEGAGYYCPRFEGTALRAVNAKGVHFSNAQMIAADLVGLDIQGSYLACATFEKACLRNANLEKCDLTQSDLSEADLTRANLREAQLREAKAPRAVFLEGSLSSANCSIADFSGANLESADLANAFLRGTNLYDANLSQANLSGSDMWQALTNDGTEFMGATMPDGKRFGFLTRARKYTKPPPPPA